MSNVLPGADKFFKDREYTGLDDKYSKKGKGKSKGDKNKKDKEGKKKEKEPDRNEEMLDELEQQMKNLKVLGKDTAEYIKTQYEFARLLIPPPQFEEFT